MPTISVNQAIRRGVLMVYGPFFPLVFGLPALTFAIAAPLNLPEFLPVFTFPIGLLAAWFWWSYRVPIWRLWALRQVEDIDTLHQRAVQVGIEWPYGHLLERTEIKSRRQLQLEVTIQLAYYLTRTRAILLSDDDGQPASQILAEIEYVLVHVTAGQGVAVDVLESLAHGLINLVQQANQDQSASAQDHILLTAAYFLIKFQRLSLRYFVAATS